jgi:hypothetical protein
MGFFSFSSVLTYEFAIFYGRKLKSAVENRRAVFFIRQQKYSLVCKPSYLLILKDTFSYSKEITKWSFCRLNAI